MKAQTCAFTQARGSCTTCCVLRALTRIKRLYAHARVCRRKINKASLGFNPSYAPAEVKQEYTYFIKLKLISDPTCVRAREHYWREKEVYQKLTRQKKRRAAENLHLQLSTLKPHIHENFGILSLNLQGLTIKEFQSVLLTWPHIFRS